jgi:hypothetical protein
MLVITWEHKDNANRSWEHQNKSEEVTLRQWSTSIKSQECHGHTQATITTIARDRLHPAYLSQYEACPNGAIELIHPIQFNTLTDNSWLEELTNLMSGLKGDRNQAHELATAKVHPSPGNEFAYVEQPNLYTHQELLTTQPRAHTGTMTTTDAPDDPMWPPDE